MQTVYNQIACWHSRIRFLPSEWYQAEREGGTFTELFEQIEWTQFIILDVSWTWHPIHSGSKWSQNIIYQGVSKRVDKQKVHKQKQTKSMNPFSCNLTCFFSARFTIQKWFCAKKAREIWEIGAANWRCQRITNLCKMLLNVALCSRTPITISVIQGGAAEFDTGNGEKLSSIQAIPGRLLGCCLVSLLFQCQIPQLHSVDKKPDIPDFCHVKRYQELELESLG